MPITIRAEGAHRVPSRFSVWTGSSLLNIRRASVWDGAALRRVFDYQPPISLSASPSSSFAFINSASVVAVVSENVSGLVAGGAGPFTYLWTQTSGPPASIYSPTQATTKFAMALGPGSSEDAQFTCTVTDSTGQQASAVASVNFTNGSGA